MVETVGVIDIGTNSTRLLIGRVYSGDRLEVVRTALETTRLGENLAGGRLLERAMDRTIKCLQAYRKLLESAGTDEVVVAATAAVREAGNRERFLELVKEMTGLSVRVLSGREEAVYGYLGVVSGLGVDPGETVVVDVGGGSTEFVWTQAGSPVFRSLPLGAVRMTEQEYTDAQMAAIIGTAAEEAAGLRHGRLVGVGGTVTTLVAMARQLAVYDPERVHGFRLGREEVDRILGRIEAVGVEERSRIPGLQPERADIIVAGARIVRLVMRVLDVPEMTVSEADILHGLALYGRRVSKEKA
ncbi:MAG: Ppx/GppA family phosphatase [Candidatus Desulforudis sp.]|nr:Ppx/GppA family phosphatase [Desulforudis sp.]